MKLKNLFYDLDNTLPGDFWNELKKRSEFNNLGWYDLLKATKEYIKEVDRGNITLRKPIKSKYMKYIQSTNDLCILDEIGFDFDHIDCYGNSFIQYVISENSSHRGQDYKSEDILIFVLQYPTIDMLVSKVKNKDIIYNNNNYNENILFNLCTIAETGIDCKKIEKFLKKYPKFDLHQKNNDNRNLLYQSVSQYNYKYAEYLIEKGLSYEHKFNAYVREKNNEDNYLSIFAITNFNNDAFNLFKFFAKKLDICPTKGECLLEHYLDWAVSSSDGLSDETKKSSQKWVVAILDNLMNGEVINRYENISRAIKIIDKYTTKKSNSDKFNELMGKNIPLIRAMALDHSLHKNLDKKSVNTRKI